MNLEHYQSSQRGISMKRIVICADGTWNKPDQKDRGKRKPSNVVKIARAVLPLASNNIQQVVFYDQGIGTHWGAADKYLGGGTGLGLSNNIIDCYRFIAHNYQPGDELYLWGFSRGAFTVRSLAALIALLGIIPKNNVYFLPEGYDIYRIKNKADRLTKAEEYRNRNNCLKADIKFLGVWDTVGALGVPLGFINQFLVKKYQFHDMSLPQCVKNAYQALAIDEKRKAFSPTLWDGALQEDQTMEQRWFIGVHTNIGGGYAKDGLANIPLAWMKNKAEEVGLELDNEYISHFKPYHGDELRDSFSWTYKILQLNKPHLRHICFTEHGNETVDDTAIKRFNNGVLGSQEPSDYVPENLKEWLTKN